MVEFLLGVDWVALRDIVPSSIGTSSAKREIHSFITDGARQTFGLAVHQALRIAFFAAAE